jgi:adenylate cyclase class IV
MQNVEYKAELRDLSLARTIAAAIGALRVDTLRQTDTYFRIPDAKLKRRETVGHPTEWVFYSRPDRARAKLSTFTLYPEHMARERFGNTDLPVWTVVKKSRELWTYDGVRIHLDTVENLGTFIEFEALICPERTQAKGHELVEFLRTSFAPAMGESLAVGYAELLTHEAAAVDDTLT